MAFDFSTILHFIIIVNVPGSDSVEKRLAAAGGLKREHISDPPVCEVALAAPDLVDIEYRCRTHCRSVSVEPRLLTTYMMLSR